MTDEEKNVSIYFKSSGENCIKSKLLLYCVGLEPWPSVTLLRLLCPSIYTYLLPKIFVRNRNLSHLMDQAENVAC